MKKFIAIFSLAVIGALALAIPAAAQPQPAPLFQTTPTPTATSVPESEELVWFKLYQEFGGTVVEDSQPLQYPFYWQKTEENPANPENEILYEYGVYFRVICGQDYHICNNEDIEAIGDLYFQVNYDLLITQSSGTTIEYYPGARIIWGQGDSDYPQQKILLENCGTGSSYANVTCSGTVNGVYETDLIESWYTGTSGPRGRISLQTYSYPLYEVGTQGTIEILISTEPFDCAESYEELEDVVSNGNIDANVSNPSPVSVAQGETYKLTISGGPWNDGTRNRYDVAYSFNNTNWRVLGSGASSSSVGVEAECTNLDGSGGISTYITASTSSFYIRVNDSGNFADNDGGMIYTLTLARGVGEGCGWQFDYDPGADLLGTVEVWANNMNGVLITPLPIALQAQQWYVLEIISPWYDESAPDEARFDIAAQYQNNPLATWSPLNPNNYGAGDNVECAYKQGDKVYVNLQMPGDYLKLRVNDQTNNFNGNTGIVRINIYSATRWFGGDTCTSFSKGQFLKEGTVYANQSGAQIAKGYIGTTAPAPEYLISGRYYVLETTEGPWTYNSVPPMKRFDLAISTGTANYEPLSTWTGASCIEEIDAVGHVRVYFKVPSTPTTYFLRVNGTQYNSQTGSENYRLYEATSLEDVACDSGYSFTETPIDSFPLYANSATGTGLYFDNNGRPGYIENPMAAQIWAVEVTDLPWYENSGSQTGLYDLEISMDAGTTWQSIENATIVYGQSGEGQGEFTKVICYQQSLDGSILFYLGVKASEIDYQIKVRVASGTYSDNVGTMTINTYWAEADVELPWADCFQENSYTLWPINAQTWIPVQDINGIIQMLTHPGSRYAIEILQGPWKTPAEESYEAAMSFDNGATWEELTASTLVDCSVTDILGRAKVTFVAPTTEGAKVKIRVNDTGSTAGDWADNTGNLAFVLYLVQAEAPDEYLNDGTYLNFVMPITVYDVCAMSCMTPATPTGIDPIPYVTWVGSWLAYEGCNIRSYIAWCEYHTSAILKIPSLLEKYEPFGTWQEMNSTIETVRTEVDSYEWLDDEAPDSAIGGGGGVQEVAAELMTLPDDSPFNGGEIQILGTADYSTECQSSMKQAVGTRLAQPVCFAGNAFRAVGAAAWFQILVDIISIVAFVRYNYVFIKWASI